MPLADEFQEIVDALPSDWTDMELDLRVEEDRYIDAATTIAQVNGQPYSSAARTTAASSAPSRRSSKVSSPSMSSGRSIAYPLRRIMPLAEAFNEIVQSLPSDWTDLELDLRVEEDRYVDAASLLVTCNAQPYSNHDWHFRIIVAHQFGHAAAAPVVHGTLKLLDDAGIQGEIALREVREGRVEVTQMWGRPESVRQEFRRIRSQ